MCHIFSVGRHHRHEAFGCTVQHFNEETALEKMLFEFDKGYFCGNPLDMGGSCKKEEMQTMINILLLHFMTLSYIRINVITYLRLT